MGQLPLICLKKELIFRHVDAAALCKHSYDLLEFLLIRGSEVDGHTEAGNKRQFLLNRIVCVKFFIPVRLVTE